MSTSLTDFVQNHPDFQALRESDKEKFLEFTRKFDLMLPVQRQQFIARIADFARSLEPLLNADKYARTRERFNKRLTRSATPGDAEG